MAYDLPERGDPNWDTKLNASIEAVKATADAALPGAAAPVGETTADMEEIGSRLEGGDVVRLDRPGAYLVTTAGIDLAANKTLEMAPGTSLRFPDSVVTGAAGVHRAVWVYSGSRFRGTIDGNRAGQTRTGYNTAGGRNGAVYSFGLFAQGSAEDPVTGLWIDATITGVVDSPAYLSHVHNSYVKIRASDSGGAVELADCENVFVDIEVDTADNDGWKTWAHAVDLNRCRNIWGRIVIRDQDGNDTIASGGSLSNYVSGFTAVDCDGLQLSVNAEMAEVAGQSLGVGVSLVGVRNSEFKSLRVVGYSDVLLELGGVVDCTFYLDDLDGAYRLDGTAATGRGIALYNNSMRGDYRGRTWEYTRNCTFYGGTIRRLSGRAIDLASSIDTTWIGVKARSSKYGLTSKFATAGGGSVTDGPAIPSGGVLSGHRFIDCDFSWNENHGVMLTDALGFKFTNCRAINNGQSNTVGSARSSLPTLTELTNPASGFATVTGTSKTGLQFIGCEADDTQNFTAPGFIDPNTPTIVAVDRVERYGEGQTITLQGAGAAGADLKVRINSIERDELTVSTAASTFPTTSGTGTISTSGTTLTGSGTAFNTQLIGRAYIKVGSDYRRIVKVASNTSATLETAFPTNLAAGASFSIVQCTIQGHPSQNHAHALSSDTASVDFAACPRTTGNVTSWILNGAPDGAVTGLKDPLTARQPPQLRPASGQYLVNWASAWTTGALTTDRVYYVPVVVTDLDAFDQIAVELTTAPGTSCTERMNIYSSDPLTGKPLTKLGTDVTVSTLAATTLGFRSASFSWTPTAVGLYYLAMAVQSVSGAAPQYRQANSPPVPGIGPTTSGGAGAPRAFYEAGGGSTLPTTATPSLTAASPPVVFLRRA